MLRRFEAKTLAGTTIENPFHAPDLSWGYVSKIGFLRIEASNQTVGVFHGAFFPTVEWQAEERPSAQNGIDLEVFDVLRAVVIGDGPAESLGKLTEATIDSHTGI